jgi:hypothetical protein
MKGKANGRVRQVCAVGAARRRAYRADRAGLQLAAAALEDGFCWSFSRACSTCFWQHPLAEYPWNALCRFEFVSVKK